MCAAYLRTRSFRRISRSRSATSMNTSLAVPERLELSRRVVHIYGQYRSRVVAFVPVGCLWALCLSGIIRRANPPAGAERRKRG